jgi:hypothetical protein
MSATKAEIKFKIYEDGRIYEIDSKYLDIRADSSKKMTNDIMDHIKQDPKCYRDHIIFHAEDSLVKISDVCTFLEGTGYVCTRYDPWKTLNKISTPIYIINKEIGEINEVQCKIMISNTIDIIKKDAIQLRQLAEKFKSTDEIIKEL